jgi:hypothetical protein
MSAATIAQLKITLDDVKPSVLRRIEVPFDIDPRGRYRLEYALSRSGLGRRLPRCTQSS